MCRPCVLRDLTSLDFHVNCECVRVINLTNGSEPSFILGSVRLTMKLHLFL